MKLNCSNKRLPLDPSAAISPRRGIALVITLVMLSVTLVMAVAFLALARRERASISTGTDTTTAKLAADSALAAAQSQILANVLATNKGAYTFGLLVSTNYINTNGFSQGVADPLNVNYNHLNGSYAPLSADDFNQNVANLQYLPRVPVFVPTNDSGASDFRFYLDLNRNGAFDDTAYIDNTYTNSTLSEIGDPQWIGVLTRPDSTHSANNPFVSRYAFIALPVGNTLDINAIHNQTLNQSLNLGQDGFYRNESVGSWELNLAGFLADLNADEWDPAVDPYLYNEPSTMNRGAAFEDAFSILTNRYAANYNTLATPGTVVPPFPPAISLYDSLVQQGIDGYTAGNLQTGPQLPLVVNGPGSPVPWAGSDNTNHFYDLTSDLFDSTKTSPSFINRLNLAGGSLATNYDRYTYYHLLDQLGTDSDPDDGKMNLNYQNVINGTVVPNMETNCYVWDALGFFTNAADRMLRVYTTNWFAANPADYLRTYFGLLPTSLNPAPAGFYNESYVSPGGFLITNDPTGFGLTNRSANGFLGWTNVVPGFGIANIPVFINGQFVYSPAVNRILQLAANLYDASTTNFYPSVFRPVFEVDAFTNLFIVGYTNVVDVSPSVPGSDPQFTQQYDVSQLGSTFAPVLNTPFVANFYGVPWIIGAKKNLPAFNQLSLLNTVQVVRKLQVARPTVDGAIVTNHLYELWLTNSLGVSFWNSYSNDYRSVGPISVIASDIVQMTVTNSDTPGVMAAQTFNDAFIFTTNFWPGSHWSHKIGEVPANQSFIATTWTNTVYSNVIYKTYAKQFVQPTDLDVWESLNASRDLLPHFGLLTTNWLRAIVVDDGHVIDYVQLRGPIDGTNFSLVVDDPDTTSQPYLWSTNLTADGTSWGYVSQIDISRGNPALPASAVWDTSVTYPAGLTTRQAQTEYFDAFFTPSHQFTFNGITYYSTNLVLQAGYTATRTIFVPYLYQVNDPLVHDLASDLDAGEGAVWAGGQAIPNGVWTQADGVLVSHPSPNPPFGADILKGRFQPWGAVVPAVLQKTGYYNFGNGYNPIYKDPGIWDPDYWNFPTNRYPTVGWIGRVHRGSPWQTVYLKATNVIVSGFDNGTNTWAAWTGDRSFYDAANSAPVQDRLLFDIFTARADDNAARGTLSVNQTNLAAWSAVFSGMVALSNNTTVVPFALKKFDPIPLPITTYSIIQPAVVDGNATVARLVASINAQREGLNPYVGYHNPDGVVGAFEHVGDLLGTPALSFQSPFLNWSNSLQQAYGISDADYEWLPQQIMGLVRATPEPRYVIYGYGQALRAAPNGLVTSGNLFGLITNYQVVAESAVRAVVSVHASVNTSGNYPVTNYTTRVESYNVLPSD